MKTKSVNDLKIPFLKALIFIIVMAVLGGIGMAAYAKHKSVTSYTAERNVLISHKLSNQNSTVSNNQNAVNDDINLMNSYESIAQDKDVARASRKYLSKSLRKKYSASSISSNVDAKIRPQSLVMSLSVTTDNAKDAAALTNAVAQGLKDELPKIQPGSGTVRLLSKVQKSDVTSKTTPNTKKYTVVGIALGGLVGLVISFVVITWKDIIDK